MRKALVVVVVLAACGGGSSSPDGAAPDAARADAVRPDAAAPDAVPLDGMLPSQVGKAVVDRIDLPQDATTADAYGFDLDGDGSVDNQLGNILSALVQAGGGSLSPQDGMTAAIDDGSVIVLVSDVGCADDCIATFSGTNPAPQPCTNPNDPATCRQHLQGTGTFDVDLAHPTDSAAHGALAGYDYDATSGTLLLPVLFLGDTPTWVQLVRAHAHVTNVGAGFGTSKVGGGIPQAQIDDRLVPGIYVSVDALIQRDCTGGGTGPCGCIDGSTGATMIGLFDDNTDCAVPLDEFRDNSLIMTLLRPDLDTDGDGTSDALSVGLGVTAVPATFALP